jgi:hypothetical protein
LVAEKLVIESKHQLWNDPADYLVTVTLTLVANLPLRRYDMNGKFQMQGGKNWILPK